MRFSVTKEIYQIKMNLCEILHILLVQNMCKSILILFKLTFT